MRRHLFLLILLILASVGKRAVPALVAVQETAVQGTAVIQHAVQPGDTWDSLAWRYGLDAADLVPYRSINTQRQPVIGTILALPDKGVNRAGLLVRSGDGGLLETAVLHNLSPWTIALQNGLPHPYRPLAYQPLFLPGPNAPRDLPAGFTTLDFSAIPARPGQALALRGQTSQPLSVTVKLNMERFNSFANGRSQVALGGTYNFYGAGQPELSIQPANAPGWSQPWLFVDDQWDFEQITLTGTAAQITQEDIDNERARLFEIWNTATPAVQWHTNFRQPLDSYLFISSNYGARRSYDGGPYNRSHEGVDFAAYGGTPVLASAAGTVVIAETLYVRGGTVIIDHGMGVYTGVYHMNNVLVNEGDVVQAGQIVGEVGSTGFSTGNHLHWDLLVNGTWVNAMAWTDQNLACWIAAGYDQPCENNEQ